MTLSARRRAATGGYRLRKSFYGVNWCGGVIGCYTHMLAVVQSCPNSFGVSRRYVKGEWGLFCFISQVGRWFADSTT